MTGILILFYQKENECRNGRTEKGGKKQFEEKIPKFSFPLKRRQRIKIFEHFSCFVFEQISVHAAVLGLQNEQRPFVVFVVDRSYFYDLMVNSSYHFCTANKQITYIFGKIWCGIQKYNSFLKT